MLIGSMVDNKIQNDLDTMLMSFSDQLIHVLVTSEARVDLPIITDIVTVVVLWGVKNRAEPDHIDPKVLKVGELFNNTPEIAEAISVGILKASWINLIYNGILPPIFHFLCLLYFALSRYYNPYLLLIYIRSGVLQLPFLRSVISI